MDAIETKSDHVPTLEERLDFFRKAASSDITGLVDSILDLRTSLPQDYLQNLEISDRIICLRGSLICWAVTEGKIVPREMQLRSILADQQGHDSLISAGTGSGKTLPIAICTLLDDPGKKKVTIVISPLKRLQKSQETDFTTRFGISTIAINEDTPSESTWWSNNIFSTRSGVEMHKRLIIVTVEQLFRTPEGHFPRMAVFLRQPLFQSLVSRFCVDEAHSFYTAGFSLYGLPAFRPSWGRLHELKASLRPSIPWHFFSATFPPHILELITEKLLRPGFDYIHVTSNRPNIIYATHQMENSIEDVRNYECFLQSPFTANQQPHVLIFFDDKKLTTKVEAHLESCLPPEERGKGIIRYYHSSMSSEYLETVHQDFISPTGTCRILITTSGESVGVDFPNVKIVATVGLPANIVDALQRGGRAIRVGGEQALFIVLYEPWALEIDLTEYSDTSSSNNINDPDRPRGKLKINSQRRERAPYSSVRLVQSQTQCLRQFYAEYLNDTSAKATEFTSPFCCDRHENGFDLQAFLPGTIYKASAVEKQKVTGGTSVKLRPKADRISLDDKIIQWLKDEVAQDPLGRPYYHILSDSQKKALLRIHSKDLRSSADITQALDENEEWGLLWAGKLFHLISEHDTTTKEAATKARTEAAKTRKALSFGTAFVNTTAQTFQNATPGTSSSRKRARLS